MSFSHTITTTPIRFGPSFISFYSDMKMTITIPSLSIIYVQIKLRYPNTNFHDTKSKFYHEVTLDVSHSQICNIN